MSPLHATVLASTLMTRHHEKGVNQLFDRKQLQFVFIAASHSEGELVLLACVQ